MSQKTADRGQRTDVDVPLVKANEHTYCGGVWYPLDERLFRKRIERLTALAGLIDGLKRHLIDPEQRARLMHAVDELLAVAAHYDALGGYGLFGEPGSPS